MVVFDKNGVEHGFIKDRGANEDLKTVELWEPVN